MGDSSLRIALAQLNVWVGDIEGNARQMIDAAMTALARREAEVLEGIDPTDRAALSRLLRALLDAPVD